MCNWVKKCYSNTLMFFVLLGAASPLKTFYIYLHTTKNLTENINHPWLFKLGKWNNRHPVYWFLKFMLSCTFSFEAYAKKVGEKATKCSLKTTEVLLDADGHVLTYVSYLSRYNSSKSFEEPQKTLWCPDFFQKKKFFWCLLWKSPCPT